MRYPLHNEMGSMVQLVPFSPLCLFSQGSLSYHPSVPMEGLHAHPRYGSIPTHDSVISVLSTTTKEHLVVFSRQGSPSFLGYKYQESILYNPPPLLQ